MELLQFRGLESASVLPEGWTEGVHGDGTPWIEVNSVIFYAGVHRGRKYTKSDLVGIASRFVEPSADVDSDEPIQLDHSDSIRDGVGDIRKVWVDGEDLKARLRFEGDEAVRKVKRRKWRRLSVSLYVETDSKGEQSYKIREVSVTPFPELERAATYQKETTMPENNTAPAPEPKQEHFATDHPAIVKLREEWETQRKADREEYERNLADRDKKIEETAAVLRFQSITRKIESYGRSGKSVPSMDEAELKLLESFSEEQIEMYDALKAASPAYVDFGTVGDQEATSAKSEEWTDEQWVAYAKEAK